MHLKQVATGARLPECRSERIARLGSQSDACAIHPVGEFRSAALVEPLQRVCNAHRRYLPMAQGGQVRRELREQPHVLLAAAHGPGAQARSNGEQSLRQRMPSFLGCDFGPQQVDEPIPRDRARASLEMEVEQDGKMFLGTESDGRVATIHELRGSEKGELKQR